MDNLAKMEKEFPDSHDDLFSSSYTQLNRAHKIKLHAIKFCNDNKSKLITLDSESESHKSSLNQRQIMSRKTIKMDETLNFRAIPLK